MKRVILFLIIFLSISSTASQAYAANTTEYASYFGADLNQQAVASYEQQLQASQISYETVAQVNTFFSTNLSGTSLDAVKVSPASQLNLQLVSNNDPTIDALGYADLLLSLGVYNANVSVVNNNTYMSLADVINAHKQIGQPFDATRIKDFKTLYQLYLATETELHSVSKTSELFYDIENTSFADPDLGIATNGIIAISAGRLNLHLSTTLLNKLYTFEKTYIMDGNKWQGFFRETQEYEKGNTVGVSYQQLVSAPPIQPDNSGSKVILLLLFVIFLGSLGYFAYKAKDKSISV